MGCINSKKELIDINPNLYRVVNVDDEGNLWPISIAKIVAVLEPKKI